MPRTAAAYEEIKDARREAIRVAGRRVFARKGLAATRISDIAAEAGMSQGLLYHYFATKEDLFRQIVEAALEGTVALTAGARQASGSAWERLQRLCEQMHAGVLASPEYLLVVLQAFTSEAVPAEARAALERYGRRSMGDTVALIREGQAEGTVVAGNPVELALAFYACVQGVALSSVQSGAGRAPLPSPQTILRLLKA